MSSRVDKGTISCFFSVRIRLFDGIPKRRLRAINGSENKTNAQGTLRNTQGISPNFPVEFKDFIWCSINNFRRKLLPRFDNADRK